MSDEPITTFKGAEIDVSWDQRLCIHIGECGKAADDLFVGDREPWCVPDSTDKARVREVVERCPSGSLSYRDKRGTAEPAPAENRLMVAYNGPYYLTGDLDIVGVGEDMPGVRRRAALCRCGASKNKPFCDNSHADIHFEDPGAVGQEGTGLSDAGGTLSIKAMPDGPLKLQGNVTIMAATGRPAWQGDNVALCRCGASADKPFCDGSHLGVGFKSD